MRTWNLAKKKKNVLTQLEELRFTETTSIKPENIIKIGGAIKSTLNESIRQGLEKAEKIIVISKIPIPFELYSYKLEGEEVPLCTLKAMGRICSTDIIDTSIMVALNMMRRMVTKSGEKALIVAPRYEGEWRLDDAINEAKILLKELNRIFDKNIVNKVDEIINKNWLLPNFKEPLKLFHFSGHGHFTDNKSCLVLSASEEREPEFLFPDDLENYVSKEGLIKGYPIVFTSACVTGKIRKSKSGLEGLASQFIKSGATCFIGTLWEITDKSAREFATHVYANLDQFDKSLGDLILESRKNLYEKCKLILKKEDFYDPTYISFVLFGDTTLKKR
ncbi:MAG: CHAT domain-containing protein [Candidatus Lokiarchaeota archaeon]|nr:CHAT domain-containing protein [Candidatus Lokiarchaeota archaeon]